MSAGRLRPASAELIDLEQSVYYYLEDVAATIWKSALDGLSLQARVSPRPSTDRGIARRTSREGK